MCTRRVAISIVVLLVAVVIGWSLLRRGQEHRTKPEAASRENIPAADGVGRSHFIPIDADGKRDDVVAAYSPAESKWKGLKGTAVRAREVQLSPVFLDNRPERKGDKLSLQLFDDVRVEAEISGSSVNINGTVGTTAAVEGSQFGRVFMAKSANELRAKITVPEKGKVYAIHYNPVDQSHYALELDPRLEEKDEIHEHPIAPVARGDEFSKSFDTEADFQIMNDESVASTVVDVMFVYSNDALSDSGSVANVNNLIALAMLFGNDAHDNTNTGIVLHLIHSEQVSYNGSDDAGTDLARVTQTADGYMDSVHTLRSTHGADFVCLMVGDYTSDGGVSYLINTTSGSAAHAFSVVTQPAMDSYTPVHEIGHSMGLAHAKDQNTQPGPTSWSPDAHGFGDTTAGWHWHPTPGSAGYCDVMTYTSGGYFGDNLAHTRVGVFSDPGITHSGLACGDAVDGDNARVLRAMKSIYAGYSNRPIAGSTIVVDAPNGGESWSVGETCKIKWCSNGVSGNVKIDLYKGGSLYSTIAASTLNDRVYFWTVAAATTGTDFRIRVSSVANAAIYDESDANFTIDTPFYNEPLDSNPGYTTTGQWAFGVPTSSNMAYGGPGSAYSGSNIYDTNLSGVYSSTGYLTSIAIDCSDYADVRLKCMAQISVTSSTTALIQVSNNGSSWTDLYSGTDLWQEEWRSHVYDISSVADGQSTVYIRWAVQHPSGSVRSGFSVDDIKLVGVSTAAPEISISDVTVTEGDSGPVSASFTVTMNQASASTVTVNYATAGNTATSDDDFTSDSGTVTFAPGDTSETVTVYVQGDTTDEGDETYFVNLTSPSNATIADSQGVGTITDDDGAPAISISDVTVTEGDSGSSTATFTVSLDHDSASTVTVNYATAGDTAASGTDFTAGSGTVTFAPGDTSETITVSVLGDTDDESDETFFVNLTSPSNATIADSQGVGTITDDDGTPSVTLTIDTSSIAEAGGVVTVTATLSHTYGSPVTVDLGYTGTAGGADYTASSSSIVISSGTTGTATITATQDTDVEGDETVIVDITGVTNGSESGTQQVTATITDDDVASTGGGGGGGGGCAVGAASTFLPLFSILGLLGLIRRRGDRR